MKGYCNPLCHPPQLTSSLRKLTGQGSLLRPVELIAGYPRSYERLLLIRAATRRAKHNTLSCCTLLRSLRDSLTLVRARGSLCRRGGGAAEGVAAEDGWQKLCSAARCLQLGW